MVLIVACGAVFAQVHPTSAKSAAKMFLVDPTKPYVYLTVDHVGPREPRREGESSTGIWLRLHNNCIVPIALDTLSPLSPSGELQPFDHVVADGPPPFGGMDERFSEIPEYPTEHSLAGELWDKGKGEVPSRVLANPVEKPSQPKDAKMPKGYWSDVAGVATIYPGQSLYFSIPRNQLSARWHIEIDFTFDLHVRSEIPSAENYVSLYEVQVEDAIRSEKLK